MLRAYFSSFCLILILGSQAGAQGQNSMTTAPAKADSKFSAEWLLRLSGKDIHDEQSQAKVVDIRAEFKTRYLLSNSLSLDIQPILKLQSGQTQSVDGADKAENKVILGQAAAHYLPLSFLRLSAGALNQQYLHTQLLVDKMAFPAARLEALVKMDNLKARLAFESAIPTSTSLSTNTRELEKTPSLNSVNLGMGWQKEKNLFWKASVGYFIFNHLPSAIAQQSNLLGNEVDKISDAQYAFKHQFEGIEASTQLKFPLGSALDLKLSAEYLQNQKAPSDNNSASWYSLIGEIHLGKNMDLVLGGSYFSVDPEAAVSYFNANNFETNRVGYSAESALAFNKERFSVGLKYIDSEVMYSTTVQSREKVFLITLETFYADI